MKNATKVKVVKEFNHFIRVKIANCTIIRAVDPAFDGLDGVLLNFGGDKALDVTDSVVTIAAVYIKYNLKINVFKPIRKKNIDSIDKDNYE